MGSGPRVEVLMACNIIVVVEWFMGTLSQSQFMKAEGKSGWRRLIL
jgi:hypothetical protein